MKNKKQKPKVLKIQRMTWFKPIKLNTKSSVRKIPLKNLTWSQSSIRFPRLNPFGDKDRDGKLNMFDCRPFDKRKHGYALREEIARRLYDKKNQSGGDTYKKLKRIVNKYKEQDYDYMREYGKGSAKRAGVDLRTIEGKSKLEGGIRQNLKRITPLDVIKHIEKHPQLLKDIEKVEISRIPKQELKREGSRKFLGGITYGGGEEIAIARFAGKKENVGEIIEHELGHVSQMEDEKILGIKQHKSTFKFKGSDKEYKELPIEKDADIRAEEKREEWKSWKKEQPEALKDLDLQEDYDLNDNQIPDAIEEADKIFISMGRKV
jgi:hypothetical protein